MKVLAVIILLVAFWAAGSILIWQDSSADERSNRNGYAVYFYQNPLALERQDAAGIESKQVESRGLPTVLLLWLVGLPLTGLAGLAVGLTIRGQRQINEPPRRRQVQYVVVNPPRVTETVPTVSKAFPVTRRDISDGSLDQRPHPTRHCQARFHAPVRREEQSR